MSVSTEGLAELGQLVEEVRALVDELTTAKNDNHRRRILTKAQEKFDAAQATIVTFEEEFVTLPAKRQQRLVGRFDQLVEEMHAMLELCDQEASKLVGSDDDGGFASTSKDSSECDEYVQDVDAHIINDKQRPGRDPRMGGSGSEKYLESSDRSSLNDGSEDIGSSLVSSDADLPSETTSGPEILGASGTSSDASLESDEDSLREPSAKEKRPQVKIHSRRKSLSRNDSWQYGSQPRSAVDASVQHSESSSSRTTNSDTYALEDDRVLAMSSDAEFVYEAPEPSSGASIVRSGERRSRRAVGDTSGSFAASGTTDTSAVGFETEGSIVSSGDVEPEARNPNEIDSESSVYEVGNLSVELSAGTRNAKKTQARGPQSFGQDASVSDVSSPSSQKSSSRSRKSRANGRHGSSAKPPNSSDNNIKTFKEGVSGSKTDKEHVKGERPFESPLPSDATTSDGGDNARVGCCGCFRRR
uniref:Uncharacterized protein n=1 Tax=Compsopogon caeruleus TaxID=31354 RepID=A0A7S1TAH9_9RHOD|mmetsp:Transcript_14712/g.29937  ORF Transcript_14712/g.29937 Transcript_14712/m.29937 type:complete len:472 (+) Transcript_14712:311-1726(+)